LLHESDSIGTLEFPAESESKSYIQLNDSECRILKSNCAARINNFLGLDIGDNFLRGLAESCSGETSNSELGLRLVSGVHLERLLVYASVPYGIQNDRMRLIPICIDEVCLLTSNQGSASDIYSKRDLAQKGSSEMTERGRREN
jgi:hypothetical protein